MQGSKFDLITYVVRPETNQVKATGTFNVAFELHKCVNTTDKIEIIHISYIEVL